MVAITESFSGLADTQRSFSATPFVKSRGAQKELMLAVSGAKCGGCLSKIEKSIGELEGIETVRMNL